MRPATEQLASKVAEIMLLWSAFSILMNSMEISLTSPTVLGGALDVGLGFGLKKITSNFVSVVILLLEGQASAEDYFEFNREEAGTITETTPRSKILETNDSRWIVVHTEDFITTCVVNYADQECTNRYEAPFSVPYYTGINLLPEIIEKVISKHLKVLYKSYPPDCKLRGSGDNDVDFAV